MVLQTDHTVCGDDQPERNCRDEQFADKPNDERFGTPLQQCAKVGVEPDAGKITPYFFCNKKAPDGQALIGTLVPHELHRVFALFAREIADDWLVGEGAEYFPEDGEVRQVAVGAR